MTVGGAGLSGGPREGSPADLAAVIQDNAVYQQRLTDIKARHAELDAKIALAGAAADVIRLQREAQRDQAVAAEWQKRAETLKAEAEAALASARTVAKDTLDRAETDATAKAEQIIAAATRDAQQQADTILADAAAKAAEMKADLEARLAKLREIAR